MVPDTVDRFSGHRARCRLYVVLGAANLYFGDLNQDEGWYLYAARQVHEGELPYRDFAFTQGPMLPLVYSLAYPLVERWGVAGGRLFTRRARVRSARWRPRGWRRAVAPPAPEVRRRAARLHPDRGKRLPELLHHGGQNLLALRAVPGRRSARAQLRRRARRLAAVLRRRASCWRFRRGRGSRPAWPCRSRACTFFSCGAALAIRAG